MLNVHGVLYLSPLAFQALLRTSVFQASKRAAQAAASNIRQSDAKNHLSPRFRTKIHLCPPETQPDASGFAHEEPAGADTNVARRSMPIHTVVAENEGTL
jgi:hypothetical protein